MGPSWRLTNQTHRSRREHGLPSNVEFNTLLRMILRLAEYANQTGCGVAVLLDAVNALCRLGYFDNQTGIVLSSSFLHNHVFQIIGPYHQAPRASQLNHISKGVTEIRRTKKTVRQTQPSSRQCQLWRESFWFQHSSLLTREGIWHWLLNKLFLIRPVISDCTVKKQSICQ